MGVVWLAAARRDHERIVERISRDDPGAAIRVGDDIIRAVARLVAFPMLGRAGRVAGTRELSITPGPYVAVHRLVGPSDVQVLRILHVRQSWPPERGGE